LTHIETHRRKTMSNPKFNTVLTIPEPLKVEFAKRPYPRVKPGSVLVKNNDI
jgi:hypothetical protein